ncbi:hypothetical protein [Parvularcula marina]|uniref:hypothetical protein n=1 Tax=Parvularcula marina TaxID=2292771 RepID=UPI0035119804
MRLRNLYLPMQKVPTGSREGEFGWPVWLAEIAFTIFAGMWVASLFEERRYRYSVELNENWLLIVYAIIPVLLIMISAFQLRRVLTPLLVILLTVGSYYILGATPDVQTALAYPCTVSAIFSLTILLGRNPQTASVIYLIEYVPVIIIMILILTE